MPSTEALHDMLAYMSAKKVPAKGIWLEVAIQDGRVDVKEPQKVSTLL